MFEVSRLRGVVGAVAAVALALAGCSLLARAALGERPAWLRRGDSTMEGGQDAVVGRRIAGVLAERRRAGAPADGADLGVVLGASAVSMAIEPATLESSGDPGIPGRWLSLYANGANLADLRGLAELVLGDLRPRLFLLGIHPGMLARSDEYLSDETAIDPAPLRRAIAGRRLRDALDESLLLMAAPMNRAFPERTRIGHGARVWAVGAKRRMFAAMGLGAESLYRPDRDPWAVRLLMTDREEDARRVEEGRASASVRELNEGLMRRGLRGEARDRGWFDPANYSVDGPNARALVDIIRSARGRGVRVAVVLLPESTALHAAVPPLAMECLDAALRRVDGPAVPLVDLRGAIPDDQFHDNIHPRRAGRLAATRALVEALGRLRPAAGR